MIERAKREWADAIGDERAAAALWTLTGAMGNTEVVGTDSAWQAVQARITARPTAATLRPARPRQSRRWLAVAASVAVLLVAGWFLYGSGGARTQYVNELAVVTNVALPDATEVALAPGATLRVDYAQKERVVHLEGVAHFAVERDVDRPFLVETSEFGVRVLGTTFDVTTGASGLVKVVEGHVQVRGRADDTWVDLLAGQAATVLDGRAALDAASVARLGTQAPADSLRFDAVPLGEVLARVRRLRGVGIAVDSSLTACSTTADLRDVAPGDIARVLAPIFGAEVRSSGSAYLLVGGDCH